MTNDELKYHKDIFQSCNINFLIGSGLSHPYLPTLGNIEKQIEGIENSGVSDDIREYALASLFRKYFMGVMYPNRCILSECPAKDRVTTYNNYRLFIDKILQLVRKRYSTIINKQINIFTTNIDLFLEKAIESNDVELNDGFSGKITPKFNLSNYNKLVSKCSHMYDNESKLPIINLLKIHGSLNWRYGSGNNIECVYNDSLIEDIKAKADYCNFSNINDDDTIEKIIDEVSFDQDINGNDKIKEFMTEFSKLPLVNPTKKKFADTTLNLNYYEMLRFFSNELEKENSVLYILGFSMADEHIREILIRAAKSNPTLSIFIFAFDSGDALTEIKCNMMNKSLPNIKYITPPDGENFYFDKINEFFESLINNV